MGARGLVHQQSLQDALEFLDIPREQRSPIIVRDTVRASVEALAFMCRLRFSPSLQIELLIPTTHYRLVPTTHYQTKLQMQ